MDLRDFVRILLRRWRIVVSLSLAGIVAALALNMATTPVYQATVQAFVSLRDSDSTANAYQNNLFSQARVKSYAKMVDSPSITTAVVRDLRLPITPKQLARRITAAVPSDTVLIDVTVRDTSAARSRDMANAVGARFAKLIGDIETPAGSRSSPVAVTVVRSADLPGAPVSPRTTLNLVLGLLVGTGGGMALSVLRDGFDTSVKTEAELQNLTGSSALGVIGYDPAAKANPLVSEIDSRAPRSEAFRGLRTNLRFVDVDNPPQIIVVTSCGSGEGKSTTTCNLGVTMARAEMGVIIVEADLRRPHLAEYMGLEGAAGLTDVLVGRATVEDVLQPWGNLPLQVLTCGELPPNPSEMLSSDQMADLLTQLRGRAEFVLIDTPPLLPVTDAAVLAQKCDGAILVVRHGHTDRDQVGRALESLGNVSARLLGTVLTMAPAKGGKGYYGYPRYAASERAQEPERAPSGVRAVAGGDEPSRSRPDTKVG